MRTKGKRRRMANSEVVEATQRNTIAKRWSLIKANAWSVEKLRYILKHAAIHIVFDLPEYLRFILGSRSPRRWLERMNVLMRFRAIHRAVDCPHVEGELLRIAGDILAIPNSLEGDIIECGTYKGGSACKLSIVAKLTGRKLVICDSFEGLPAPKEGEEMLFKQEEWSGSYDEVRDNITRLGELDSVQIVPGWFHQTLPKLKDRRFVSIFEDADLYESILCCIENLWPALQPGCKMFTHETPYPVAVRAFTDRSLWLRKFGEPPPPLFRVGRGLGIFRPNLGYIKKPLK